MESGATSSTLDIGGFGQGVGAAPSRINDLNPDDIESIEIVKGPAAATLYGIQASNGVVRITTKRGRAGRPRWNLLHRDGLGGGQQHLSAQLHRPRHHPEPVPTSTASASVQSSSSMGFCTQTSVEPVTRRWRTRRPAPYKAGLRQQYGANVSGGTEQITYYLSGDYENERVPTAFRSSRRTRSAGALGEVPDNQIRPNALERVSVRANLGANLSADADLQANVGLHLQRHPLRRERQQLPDHHRERHRPAASPQEVNRGLVLHSRGAVRRAGPAVHRAVHRRAHRQLAAQLRGSARGRRWATT